MEGAMDQILPRVLKFDRFEVDLTRGCARVGERNIDLRPKAFDVLRHLAENAGRLVSKQELHDAVWGRVTVSDDSLVQCIRELRRKLGDAGRELIKTVPRRGYLLDVEEPSAQVSREQPVGFVSPMYFGKRFRWAAAMGGALIAVVALLLPLPKLFSTPPNLVSETDAKRVAELSAEKQLPIPAFHISSPAEDVPDPIRRFVGVWVSDTGWVYSDRQFMVIVTNVDKHGYVSGYLVNGPAKPHSRVQGPAFSGSFKGHIKAGTLRYDGYAGMHLASLTRDGNMEFKLMFQDGGTGVVMLNPVWTLAKAGRTQSAERAESGSIAAAFREF
jgi:DNA-binding winged helix-turn-helix (wHTH) protein